MSTRFFAMNIAIIGTSELAKSYAASFAFAGNEVYFATNKRMHSLPSQVFGNLDNLHCCDIEEAATEADIIFIATAPKDVREVAYWLGDIRGKVIVDATANFISIDDEQVNTVGAIKAITGSDNIVKMFYTRGYEQLLRPLFKNDKIHIVLMAEKQKTREVMKIMARDLNVNSFIDLGGFEAIPLFDSLTKCWRDLAKKNKDPNMGMAAVNY